MGEVEYERCVYEVKDEDSVKKFVYLLDEELGVAGSGFFSGMLRTIDFPAPIWYNFSG